MSEQGPDVIKEGGAEENKEIPTSPDRRAYFDAVGPLYAEQARLKGQLKDLPKAPDNAGRANEIREGI